MRINRLIAAVVIVGLVVLTSNVLALEAVVQNQRGMMPVAGPSPPGDHSGIPQGANTCPADNVGTLSDGDTIVGSTTGSTNDFAAGCGSVAGGQDEIFEFQVDLPGEWSFDTCTVAACWDTTLEIREETGGGCPGEFVACDGDGCNVGAFESAVQTFLIPASTYYLIVDGWSTYTYGDFTVTATLVVPGCTSDAVCDDGLFCNGAETCITETGQCVAGDPPCVTYEGYVAPCDEDARDSCPKPDNCLTWIADIEGSGYFWPNVNVCETGEAAWVFDDVQGSHHTTGFLDTYTTPVVARSLGDPNKLGVVYLVNSGLFDVAEGTCGPGSIIPGSTCTQADTVLPGGSPPNLLPCSGTMPRTPDNSGDFSRCEVDFYIAYRSGEPGSGFLIAGGPKTLGGPGRADEFGFEVVYWEDCPPTGVYGPHFFGDDVNLPADFTEATVCLKPGGSCCLEDLTCSLETEEDCAKAGGTYGGTGTIHGAFPCGGDPDEDGLDTLCGENCPDVFNPDQEDCDGDGEGDACEEDAADQDDDGDTVCNGVDNCPDDPNGPGDAENQLDTDRDGIGDLCDTCPNDPANDKDGDGVCGDLEECDNDPLKQDPGQCGCGFLDTDSDGDGVADCNDQCNGVDDAVFAPECKGKIPAVSEWGLVILALLLLVAGKVYFSRRESLA